MNFGLDHCPQVWKEFVCSQEATS